MEMAVTAPVHPSQGSVRTMTVEEGHVLNIDGSASKYKAGSSSDKNMSSAVTRGSAYHASDVEEGGGGKGGTHDDRVSVLSGASGRSKTTSQLEAAAKLPWYRGVTCKDIRDIMPTVLILIGGLLIMIFVIPYAFSSVIKQLEAEELIEKIREQQRQAYIEARRKAAAEAAAAAAGPTDTTTLEADTTTVMMS